MHLSIFVYHTHSNSSPLSNNGPSSKIQIEDPPIKQDCNNKRPSHRAFLYELQGSDSGRPAVSNYISKNHLFIS